MASLATFVETDAQGFLKTPFFTVKQGKIIGLNYLSSLTSNPQTIIILILLFVLILGFFIDGIPVLIILAPVVIPIINSFGIDPIYFGVFSSVFMLDKPL